MSDVYRFTNELPIRCWRFPGEIVGLRRFKRGSGELFAKTSIPISQNFGNSPLPCWLNRSPLSKSRAVPTYSFVYERREHILERTMCCLRTFQRNCYNSGADGVQLKARLFLVIYIQRESNNRPRLLRM